MHYSIVVITKDMPYEGIISDVLAPYNCHLKVAPYITDDYTEVKKSMRHDAELLPDDEKAELLEALEKDDIGTIRYYNLKHDFMYYEDINKYGEGLSTYNPNAHFEFWKMGGPDSWLVDKDMYDKLPCMQLGRIVHPLETDTDEELISKFDKLFKIYKSQLAFDKVWRKDAPESQYPTFYDFFCHRLPWDIVTADGWNEYAKGKRQTIEARRENCKEFYDILDSYPKNYWLTVVDCSI